MASLIKEGGLPVSIQDFSIEDAMRVLEVQQTLVEPPHQNNYTSHSLDEMETLIQSVQPQLAMPMAAHPSVPIGAQPIMPMVTECNVPMTAQPNMPMDAQQDVVPVSCNCSILFSRGTSI